MEIVVPPLSGSGHTTPSSPVPPLRRALRPYAAKAQTARLPASNSRPIWCRL
jgi:hypothetical protein